MIIALDIRDLRLAETGKKTYLQELKKSLENLQGADFRLICYDSIFPPIKGTNIFGKLAEHILFFIWKQIELPIRLYNSPANVLICTDYYVPFTAIPQKKIVVFHDAIFFDHPEYYQSWWLKLFKRIAIPAAKKATVVTPSEFSKTRLLEHIPAFANNIQVIHQGAKQLLPSDHQMNYPKEFPLSAHASNVAKLVEEPRFFLHVGVMEKRKNLTTLLRALKKMKHPSAPKLLLIGKRPYKKHSDDYENIAALVKELGLQDRVVFAGYLPDEDLAYFYRRAVGYVFPSRYEGFGIPILEAFYSATPVIVATGSALTEIGGEAVLYFNPDDVDTLASHMDIIAGSEAIRLEMVAMGRIELRKYSWEKSGKEFLELARKLTYSA